MPKYDEVIKSFYKNKDSKDCQLTFKENTNTEILSRAILGNLGTKEFFIDKHRDKMDKLSVREGAKYL